MKKDELLQKIGQIKDALKDKVKFLDIFREDDNPKRVLADLSMAVSRIEVLLAASEVKGIEFPKGPILKQYSFGSTSSLVRIQPCAEEYEGKTYVGILIGDMATASSIGQVDGEVFIEWGRYNPAIYVPDLQKIIFGYESWWGEIESEKDLKEITKEDIENTWYVKLLKQNGRISNDL